MNAQKPTSAPVSPSPPSSAQQTSDPVKPGRQADLDWLRTMIVLAIIPYHALLLYTVSSGSVIRQPAAVPWTPLLYRALEDWGIPFIFLLAGAASAFALRSRSLGAYGWERVSRLVIPVALVALLFAPVRAYYLALTNPALLKISPVPIAHPERMGNIGAFFLEYWRILFTTGSSIVSRNPIAHLWFVPRLIVISLLCAPLLQRLHGRWPRWVERRAARGTSLVTLLLGGGLVPVAVAIILEPGWLNRWTAGFPLSDVWSAFALCLFWFLAGALIYSSDGLRQAARKLAYVTLALALAGWGVTLGIMLSGHAPPADYSAASMLYTFARVYSYWLLTLALVGLGARFLSAAAGWQSYLTAATFPVYVLHLPLLLPIAYYLQYLPLPWPLQAALAIGLTVAGAFALYEYVVRRAPGIRVLFGMSLSPPAGLRSPRAPSGPPALA